MTPTLRSLLLMLTFLFSHMPLAQAGIFCVTGPGTPPQCHYEDVASCLKDSAAPDTYCSVSPDAVLMYSGGGLYCSVGVDRIALCLYTDRAECIRVSARNTSVCINRNAQIESSDDASPFRFDSRIQN